MPRKTIATMAACLAFAPTAEAAQPTIAQSANRFIHDITNTIETTRSLHCPAKGVLEGRIEYKQCEVDLPPNHGKNRGVYRFQILRPTGKNVPKSGGIFDIKLDEGVLKPHGEFKAYTTVYAEATPKSDSFLEDTQLADGQKVSIACVTDRRPGLARLSRTALAGFESIMHDMVENAEHLAPVGHEMGVAS